MEQLSALRRLGNFDLHAHAIRILKNSELYDKEKSIDLEEMMGLVFENGSPIQAVTEHPPDLIYNGITFNDYFKAFHNVPRNGKLVGIEVNFNRHFNEDKTYLDLKNLTDKTGIKPDEIISNVDFGILSIHSYYHGVDGRRKYVHFDNINDYSKVLNGFIGQARLIRNMKDIPIVLGHPGEASSLKLKLGNFSDPQLEEIAENLLLNDVYPELNLKSLEKGLDILGRYSILRAYIKCATKNHIKPIISFGTDAHSVAELERFKVYPLIQYLDLLQEVIPWPMLPSQKDVESNQL